MPIKTFIIVWIDVMQMESFSLNDICVDESEKERPTILSYMWSEDFTSIEKLKF